MILETNRLILRPWREDDAEDLYIYASDLEVWELMYFGKACADEIYRAKQS